jgi:hypothetical protein
MMIEILKATIAVSVAAFLLGGLLYGNPLVDALYHKGTKTGVIKTWKSQGVFYSLYFLVTLVEVFVFSVVFSMITIHPATTWWSAGLFFGLFHFLIRILPRTADMALMVNYPWKLLIVEMVNGGLIGLLMGVGIAFFLEK